MLRTENIQILVLCHNTRNRMQLHEMRPVWQFQYLRTPDTVASVYYQGANGTRYIPQCVLSARGSVDVWMNFPKAEACSCMVIETPSADWLAWGPSNHVLDGVDIPTQKGANLGVVRPTEKHWESAAVYAAKWSFNRQQRHDMRCGLSSKFFDHSLFSSRHKMLHLSSSKCWKNGRFEVVPVASCIWVV